MIIWIVLTVMAVVVAALLVIPLVRRHDAGGARRAASLAVLRDQLRDVDDQERGGTVSAEEAQSLRTEIKRRLLAEDGRVETARRPLAQDALGRFAVIVAALVALAATGIYAMLGRPDLAGAPSHATAPAEPPLPPELDNAIARIEARLAEKPDDARGWHMLGLVYTQAGRYTGAVEAYRKALALGATGSDLQSALGEALVLAANGIVTPEAKTAFAKAVAEDSDDPRARYFLGMARYQSGDRKGAVDDWIKLLAETPPDAPWATELRASVEQAAAEQGIDLTGRLPAAPRGPTAGDIANAETLSAEDRRQMIQGMVDGLAQRLKANPRDAEGWERLIRSRMVLGDRAGAHEALTDAKAAFGDDPAMQKKLDDTAASLGIGN